MLSAQPPTRRAMFLLSTATYGDRVDALGESVRTFQFGVHERSISSIIIKISRSTV